VVTLSGHAGGRCNAGTLTIRDGKPLKLVVFDQSSAIERARRYRENSVLWSSARKVSCRAFWRLMMKVLAARDELVALEQAGWRTVGRVLLRAHERHAALRPRLRAHPRGSPPSGLRAREDDRRRQRRARPDAPLDSTGWAAWNKTGGPSVLEGGGGIERATRSRRRSCHA
jgi:hypothetical protein